MATSAEAPPYFVDSEISDEDLDFIAQKLLKKWEELSPYLGLDEVANEAVRRTPGGYGDQKRAFLHKWKSRQGSRATFRALINAAKKARRMKLAVSIEDILRSRFCGPSTGNEAVHFHESVSAKLELHSKTTESSVSGKSLDTLEPNSSSSQNDEEKSSLPVYAQEQTTQRQSPITVRYVQAKIKQFKKRFKELKKGMQQSLKRLKIEVEKVIATIKSLPADNDIEHKLFSESQSEVFDQATNHSMLLGQLDFYMDYLSYHLLDYLITEYGLEDVKAQMESYKSDLEQFRIKIPLTLFSQTYQRKRVKAADSGEIVLEFYAVSGDRTMEDLEQFKRKYTTHNCLKDCSMIFAGIQYFNGTLKCSWYIPQCLVDKLEMKIPRESFNTSLGIIAGTYLFPSLDTNSMERQSSEHQQGALSELENQYGKDSTAVPVEKDSVPKHVTRAYDHKKSLEDYPFVKEPPEELFCPVTFKLLLQPHLTSCCGQHVSQDAVKRIKKEGKGCPLCNSKEWFTMMNKHFLRQVTHLPVLCRDTECGWKGILSELENHMQSYHPSFYSADLPAEDSNQTPVNEESEQGSLDQPTEQSDMVSTTKKPTGFVREEIRMLKERFNNLKRRCVICLDRSVPLDVAFNVLKSLPADDSKNQPHFMGSHISVFSQTLNYSELFGTLGFHMNYLSCQLLDYLVNEFGLEEIKKELEDYKSDLQHFQKSTTVKVFSQVEPNEDVIPPPNFRKLISIFNLTSEAVTLDDLEQFRKEYSHHYGFYNYTLTLAKTDLDPVTATWFIPESVHKMMMKTETIPRKLLFKCSVLKLEVDGGCVYRYHTKERRIPATTSSSSGSVSASLGAIESVIAGEEKHNFIEHPSEDFFCPVTHQLLLQPHLTSCCGQHLSHQVATELKRGGKICPLCNAEDWSTIWDKRFQREVKSLSVFCQNKTRGCGWKGPLSSLDYHLQSCPKRPSTVQLPKEIQKKDKELTAVDHKGSILSPGVPLALSQDHAYEQTGDVADSNKSSIEPDPSELMESITSDDMQKVDLLLSRGADPNISPPLTQSTPLMEACAVGSVAITCLLLDYGADPNLGNDEKWTPLLEAANSGHPQCVDLLIERGANPDWQSTGGWSPLMAAVFKGHDDIALRIIRAGATPHIQDKNQTNAILLAVERHKHDTVVNALLDHVDNPSQLDIQDSGGKTALTWACMKRKLKVVKRLLDMRANPNILNNEGESPIMIAAALGEREIQQVLLKNGANPTAVEEVPATESKDHSVLCISMVSVICEETVKVTNEGQHIVWEDYGLRLHIPPNSLPEDCSELQLTMTVSRATDCELRENNGILISAVYSFSHNLGERKLRQKGTLEMQHCAQGSYIPLCIVQSDSLVPPHKFQSLEGGKFDSSDRYASIELDHFCSFSVFLAWRFRRNLKTCAVLYYTNIKPCSFHFQLYIVPHLDAIHKEITSEVARADSNFKYITTSRFKFQEASKYIRLVLPKDPESRWIMEHVNSEQMEKNDAVIMHWGVSLIPFHVEVSWTGDLQPANLAESVILLEGGEDYCIRIISPHTIVTECETIGSTTSPAPSQIQLQEFKGLSPPTPRFLMSVVGVDVQADWYNVGLELGLEPSALESINRSYSHDLSRCMTRVFTVWHESQSSEYSWKKLAEALCSRTVNKPHLLPKMLERIHQSSV